jgi:hypothetical protein
VALLDLLTCGGILFLGGTTRSRDAWWLLCSSTRGFLGLAAPLERRRPEPDLWVQT